MCGLVGVFGRISKQHLDMFEDLWYMDTVRGIDGVGANVVTANGKNKIFKDNATPWEVFYSKPMRNILKNENDLRCVMGHNRWATKGSINQRMCHPFRHGNIVGMHNGTLHGQHRLLDHLDFDSDSENLIYNINKEGIEETWAKTDGAAALTWWDKKAGTLNFIRNSDRPFWFCYTEDEETMFYASEKWMLDAVFARRGLKKTLPEQPHPDLHFQWVYEEERVRTQTANGAGYYTKVSRNIKEKVQKLSPFVWTTSWRASATNGVGTDGSGYGDGSGFNERWDNKLGKWVDLDPWDDDTYGYALDGYNVVKMGATLPCGLETTPGHCLIDEDEDQLQLPDLTQPDTEEAPGLNDQTCISCCELSDVARGLVTDNGHFVCGECSEMADHLNLDINSLTAKGT
jgi:predicted glutamine amidotransferase